MSKCFTSCVWTNLSIILIGSGVNAIGLRSPVSSGMGTFGIGTTMALRHAFGKYPLYKDLSIMTSNCCDNALKHIFYM